VFNVQRECSLREGPCSLGRIVLSVLSPGWVFCSQEEDTRLAWRLGFSEGNPWQAG
jgi:hypothetical protein